MREVLNRTWARGAGGIVRIEQGLDGTLAYQRAGDAGSDAVAGHVRQFLIHELGGIGAAFADQAGVEPLLGDALELAEEMELRLLAGVTPFRVEQALGDVEEQRGRPHVAQVLQVHVHAFADDAGIAGDGGADEVGAELEDGIFVEVGCEAFLGQFDAVAFDAGEADFERVALRADGFDLDRLARRLRRGDDGLGREVEGNAEDIGVFDIEETFVGTSSFKS